MGLLARRVHTPPPYPCFWGQYSLGGKGSGLWEGEKFPVIYSV